MRVKPADIDLSWLLLAHPGDVSPVGTDVEHANVVVCGNVLSGRKRNGQTNELVRCRWAAGELGRGDEPAGERGKKSERQHQRRTLPRANTWGFGGSLRTRGACIKCPLQRQTHVLHIPDALLRIFVQTSPQVGADDQ